MVPPPATHARRRSGQGEADNQRAPRHGRENPPVVVVVLPIDAREMSLDPTELLREKEMGPVELHAERIRRAIAPLIALSYDDTVPPLEDLGAPVLTCTETTRLSDVAAEQALEPPASTGDLAGPPIVDGDWLVLSTVHSAKRIRRGTCHSCCRWELSLSHVVRNARGT